MSIPRAFELAILIKRTLVRVRLRHIGLVCGPLITEEQWYCKHGGYRASKFKRYRTKPRYKNLSPERDRKVCKAGARRVKPKHEVKRAERGRRRAK